MFDLCEAIKNVISKYVARPMPLTHDLETGDNVLSVQSRRFNVGDQIAIYRTGDTETGAQIREVQAVYVDHRLCLDDVVQSSFPAHVSYVQKCVNGEFIRGIHNGDPPVLPSYPAICVNSTRQENERWLIGGMDRETYAFDVLIYADASLYVDQYEALLTWQKMITDGLFRAFRPLVQPYTMTTLASPYDACDTMIHVSEADVFPRCDYILVEDVDHTRGGRIIANCGGGYYRISNPLGADFSPGANVVQEHRFIYSTDLPSVVYLDTEKDRSVKAAVLSYVCQEAKQRPMFAQDPMLF